MKFSITQMLYAMVVMAFVAAIIGAGANGSPLAYGIGISLCTLAIYFTLFATLYWFAFLFSGRRKPTSKQPQLESSPESEA